MFLDVVDQVKIPRIRKAVTLFHLTQTCKKCPIQWPLANNKPSSKIRRKIAAKLTW